MVPASAATMLKVAGHEAIWDDAIAEQKPYDSWLKEVAHESPELIAIEAKAPVIKRYWKTISDIKEDFRFPGHLWLDAAHHELAPAQASAQTRLVQFRFCFGEADPLVTVVQEMGRLTGIATPALDSVLAMVTQRARIAGLYDGVSAPSDPRALAVA